DALPSAGSLASAYHCERSHHAPRHGKRHDPPIEAFRTHTPFSLTENAVRLRGGCPNSRDTVILVLKRSVLPATGGSQEPPHQRDGMAVCAQCLAHRADLGEKRSVFTCVRGYSCDQH